jgi:uncharacterized protein YbjT (DUF2867 family)
MAQHVFVTGGTGYVGRPLLCSLRRRGHFVSALARQESFDRLPSGIHGVLGDALKPETYVERVPKGSTFVHLVGVAHPSPHKASQFESIDLASVRASLQVAQAAQVGHFIYLSVAHPAPVMQAYVAARVEAERLIAASAIPATVLRPWYVLGPGHRWPYLLLPMYWLAQCLTSTRSTAHRLGLVTRAQMVAALVRSVETASTGVRVIEVPEIGTLRQAK